MNKLDYVLDTGILTLFFAGHQQARTIIKDIIDKDSLGYIPRVILIEFYYKTHQKFGRVIAQNRLVSILQQNFIELAIEQSDIIKIGMIKVKYPKLSLVDCTLANFGLIKKATVVTTEEPLTKVEKLRVIKLDF